jgi:hypothetical protein
MGFFDAQHAMAVGLTDRLSVASMPSQELRVSSDGGKSWSPVSELKSSPCDTGTLQQIDVVRRLVCVFRDGSIQSAGLSGEWVVERASR